MRPQLLIVAATLALAGCGDKQAQQTDAGSAEDLATQNVSANDITAIDAATGYDANMAADAEINLIEPVDENEVAGNDTDNSAANTN